MEGILPQQNLQRKKSPYPKTFDPRYEMLVSQRHQKILEDKSSPLLYLLNPDGIFKCIAQDCSWPWYGQLMRRPQTMAYFIQIAFWLEHYQVELLF